MMLGVFFSRPYLLAILVVLLVCLAPTMAFAAEVNIDNSQTFVLSTLSDGDELRINTDQAVTLTGNAPIVMDGVEIICTVAGVNITLNNVNSNSAFGNGFEFTGVGNKLTLTGVNKILGGSDWAGINIPYSVDSGVGLEIGGTGSLEVEGNNGGAGIGGSKGEDAGTIKITGGEIKATGSSNSAGIGGGEEFGEGNEVIITGGKVIAIGRGFGAGIGGGSFGVGGSVKISNGAVVYAEGGSGGEDIGKGMGASSSGTLEISGASTSVFTGRNVEFSGADLKDDIVFSTDSTTISKTATARSVSGEPWDSALGVYTVPIRVDLTLPTLADETVEQNATVTELDATPTDGDGTYTYQWYKNDQKNTSTAWSLSGQTSATYTPSSDTAVTVYYYCKVTETTGDTESKNTNIMTLTINPETFTVTYDGNGNTGGTAPTDSNKYESGDLVTVKGNTGSLVKTGYTFNGWNTDSSDYESGMHFNVNDTHKINESVKVYAEWRTNLALPTLSDETVDKNATVTELNATPTVGDGTYTYQWYSNDTKDTATPTLLSGQTSAKYTPSSSTAGTVYYYCAVTETTGDKETSNTNVMALAVNGSTYNIKYDANGGDGFANQSGKENTVVTLNDGSSFSKKGYIIDGWTILGKQYKLSALYTLEKNVPADAVWVKDTDGDGVSDADETRAGSDPNDSSDEPQTGAIAITLLDNSGNPRVGWTVVLNSEPIVRTTDANGQAVFPGVSLAPHTLSVRNGSTQVGSYNMNFTRAASNSTTVIENSAVSSTVADSFLSLNVTLQNNASGVLQIISAAFTQRSGGLAGNPKTGDFSFIDSLLKFFTSLIK